MIRKFWAILAIGFFIFSPNYAQDFKALDVTHWDAGEVRFDQNQWVEVIVGEMPLVISVPHGGLLKPDGMADRDCSDVGRIVRGIDRNTMETARAIEAVFLREYGKRPYIIINHIARRKVDQNRDIELATCGDPLGEAAWHSYHSSIDSSLAHAVQDYGHAFLIDLHGHGHANQRLEWGYVLNSDQLRAAYKNNEAQNKHLANRSSLANYLNVHPQADFKEMLFGENAIGSLLYDEGVPGTPAIQDPHPIGDEAFFGGGFITQQYTSPQYPSVYGVQIELHFKGIRDTDANRETFAKALGNAYFKFSEKYPFKPSK